MAKLYTSHNDNEAFGTFQTFASLGLMCCMVVTLIGIKIWWFKHRLSFDQSSTSNGAAGGSQPRVVTRSRSSKDKRLSQQFREPVVVHGIFRKRGEYEMEGFESVKQLPPVRPTKLSLSKSTPSLFRPPSALKEEEVIDNEVLTIPAPPRYDPPAPPTFEVVRPIPPTTLQIQNPFAAPATVPPIATITTPDIKTTTFESEAFKEDNDRVLNWLNSTEHQTLQQQQQQQAAAVTPMSENEEQSKEIEAAITVHQIQSPAVEQLPKALARNTSETIEKDEEVATRRYIKAKPTFEPFKKGPNIMERRVTGFQKPDEDAWQKIELEKDEADDGKNITYDNVVWAKNRNDHYFEDEFGKMELHTKIVQFQEEERIDQVDNATTESDLMIKERRPTGYVRNVQDLLKEEDTALDADVRRHKQSDHELWQEMEKDIDGDFSVNIEEEFNKIRHTYEENEEGFLESPTGYGKSIDEDWANFENLENTKDEVSPPSIKERRPTGHIKQWVSETHLESDGNKDQQKGVTFNLEDDDEDKEENKSTFIAPRRQTGFVRDKVEFEEQLWAEDETSTSNKPTLMINYKLDADDARQYEEPLTERRPTGYVRASETMELSNGAAASESIIEVEHESPRRPKPRQKVTFQFQTEAYSPPQTPSDIIESDVDGETDADEEEHLTQATMPKPMQRMTKMSYTNDTAEALMEPIPPPRVANSAALLFSTQVSAEYASAANEDNDGAGAGGGNDSWSAIRKHRNLTEEFQQRTLEGETTVTTSVLSRPAPKAAYRNPLAQMALNTNRTAADDGDADEDYVKPRTMRDMKKAQSRRVESLQFEAHSAGTAEA